MFIHTNSIQNVNRITTNMQDRKVIQDYNCPKSLNEIHSVLTMTVCYY